MAPFDPTNTNRLWVKKQGVTGEHELLFRGQIGSTLDDLVGAAHAILTAARGIVYEGDTWNSARYSARNSHLSFPTDWDPITGNNGTDYQEYNRPFFLDFVGRGAGGHRVRWSVQGAVQVADVDYRMYATEYSGIATIVNAFNAQNATLADITGAPVIIYPYANVGYNAYFQRKQRRIGGNG